MKRVSKILMLLCAFIFLISGVGTVIYSAVKDSDFFNENVSAQRLLTDNRGTYVSVVEDLFTSSNGRQVIDPSSMADLMNYLTGIDNGTLAQLESKMDDNGGRLTAKNIRDNAGGGKASGKDIEVTIDDMQWECVYVSRDDNKNVILTLWLDNSKQQKKFGGRSTNAGSYYGFYGDSLYSDWSSDWAGAYTINYPSAVYGASYIRCVTLNNGGTYFEPSSNPHNPDASSATTRSANQVSSSVFARFTMAQKDGVSNSITPFIVKPSSVSWQKVQPLVGSYTHGNDSWEPSAYDSSKYESGSSGSFYSSVLNRSGLYQYYSAWSNDYIWLPSITEVGSSETDSLWGLSNAQRQNLEGKPAVSSSTTIGDSSLNISGDKGVIRAYSWTRSANSVSNSTEDNTDKNKAYRLIFGVDTNTDNNASQGKISYDSRCTLAVRPAFHFNLTLAYTSAFGTSGSSRSHVIVQELFNDTGKNSNPAQMRQLMEYLTGKEYGTLDDLREIVLTQEKNMYTSEKIRAVEMTDPTGGDKKYKGMNIKIKLLGLWWECCAVSFDKYGEMVLTLWLDGNYQNWENKSKTVDLGAYYGLYNGGLYCDWSSDWTAPFSSDYPSSIYGISYIRAFALNAVGKYADSTDKNVSAYEPTLKDNPKATPEALTANDDHIFAKFTNPNKEGSITDFIVKPVDIEWQEKEEGINEKIAYGNEAWSSTYAKELSFYGETTGEKASVSAYLNKASNYYEAWKEDYIWLPSYSEIGASGSAASGTWKLDAFQRQNGTSTTPIISAKVGLERLPNNTEIGNKTGQAAGDIGYIYDHTWTRSAGYSFDPSGDSTGYRFIWISNATGGSESYMWDSRCTMAVRPAFHLNLSRAYLSAFGSVEEAEIKVVKSGVEEESQTVVFDGYSRTVVVYFRGLLLNAGQQKDYTITINDSNTDTIGPNVGVYLIRIRGENGYSGEKHAWFAIAPYEISDEPDCRVTVGQPPDQPETGQPIRPKIDVTDNIPSSGLTELVLNTDYAVGYANNVGVGTARVTITGIGNYFGSVERTFSIGPAAKYDKEGGYWYIEIGEAPQTRVSDAFNEVLATSATSSGTYSIQEGSSLSGYVYNNVKYAEYNNRYYVVEPIRWRITGRHSSGDLISGLDAICASIVFISEYSTTALPEKPAYVPYAATSFRNILDDDLTGMSFMNNFVPRASKLESNDIFVASGQDIQNVAETFEVKFSDLVFDVLRSKNPSSEAVYFTRDNGTDVNNMITYNMYGNKTNHYANELYGVQFVINISRLICGTII